MRLSHSATQMYLACGMKYKLHYIEKLRSTKLNSPLFFGSAIDDALCRIVLEKKKKLTPEEKEIMLQDEYEHFDTSFEYTTHNRENTLISKNNNVVYFRSDYDPELLETQDKADILAYADALELDLQNPFTFMEQCIEVLKAKSTLSEAHNCLYNYICWLSLRRKAHKLIKAFRNEVLPLIEEVFSIQKRISLSEGDCELVGYIDAVISFLEEPGKQYVVDFKTSSKKYADDSVVTSEQLATYGEHEQNFNCAYIVVEKKLRKREPQVRINIIKDEIQDDFVEKVFDNIGEVMYKIKEGVFEKNHDSCFMYGQKCPYFDKCRTNCLKNLIYLDKGEEDGNKGVNKDESPAN